MPPPDKNTLTSATKETDVRRVSIDGRLSSLSADWPNHQENLDWSSPFILPQWMQAWWRSFQPEAKPLLVSVHDHDELIGLAPLMRTGEAVTFVGGPDVCDYQDFIVAPNRERTFFESLLDELDSRGVARLDLPSLRFDSTALTHLLPLARERGLDVFCWDNGVSLEMDLPKDWSQYQSSLSSKQRHEIRRKIRRMNEAAETKLRLVESGAAVREAMDIFLGLFRQSRGDKDRFMTGPMEDFFRSLAEEMANLGLLRIFILDLDGRPAAAAMCFDYNNTVYLYNNGYDPHFSSLSVGILCKVLTIKASLEWSRKKYSFLKGAERYKYHLGGREVELSGCVIALRGSAVTQKERMT